ncbi:MAG: tetratricopeptide repeat protein, partial [Kiritimatiellae bacterium]|nr:tetratricopeptide repeat protein [Kiritimatiellia bacterium]
MRNNIEKIGRFVLTIATFFVAFECFGVDIKKAASLMENGNYAEAYVAYTNIIFASDSAEVTDGNRAQALLDAPRCLAKLRRFDEAEPLLDKAILERKEFAVHVAYSQALGELPHYGKMVKGVFSRVNEWGVPYSSVEHDRVKRLKCLKAIMPDLAKQTKLRQRWFWNEVVNALEMNGRNRGAAWKLLESTSLTEIPQVEERVNRGESDFEVGPAPVDENGEPLFYGLVKSWEDAKNDGERWMFANTARAAVDDFGRRNSARSLGVFAENQFGGYRLRYEDDLKNLIGDLRSLDDDETITRLANGIKRFKLPIEYNYIRMWRELNEYHLIAREYERRYQFVKACEMWKKAGKGCSHCVERISSPNVSLSGNVPVVSYKKRGRFEVNFRNADELEFSLVKIDVARYLEEV